MSEPLTIDLALEEAKDLYRLLVQASETAHGDRLALFRVRLEKELFRRVSIEEMETIITPRRTPVDES